MADVMTDATVLGTGAMGAAVAKVLLAHGKSVTVWNRTPERARPLADLGAVVAPSLSAAVAASECSFIVLLDYPSSDPILRVPEVEAVLPGRTLLQMTSGTPDEAVGLGDWAFRHGAQYLEGYPMCFEAAMERGEGVVLWSGPQEVFTRCAPLVDAMGKTIYLGGGIELTNAALMGSVPLLHASILGFLQGIAVAEAAGLEPDRFRDAMLEILPALRTMIIGIGDRTAGLKSSEEPVSKISNQLPVAKSLLEMSHDLGVSEELPRHLVDWFERAVEAGLGLATVDAMIALFRQGG